MKVGARDKSDLGAGRTSASSSARPARRRRTGPTPAATAACGSAAASGRTRSARRRGSASSPSGGAGFTSAFDSVRCRRWSGACREIARCGRALRARRRRPLPVCPDACVGRRAARQSASSDSGEHRSGVHVVAEGRAAARRPPWTTSPEEARGRTPTRSARPPSDDANPIAAQKLSTR